MSFSSFVVSNLREKVPLRFEQFRKLALLPDRATMPVVPRMELRFEEGFEAPNENLELGPSRGTIVITLAVEFADCIMNAL